MRLFVAAVPPEEVVEDLDAFLDVRRDARTPRAEPLRWSPAEHLHVTLAFLAEVADRHLDELLERLARAAARRTPVPARIAGGGAFPHVVGARVLWAGLEVDEAGRTELSRMATGARAAAARTGIAVDGQRFRPHVTVARTRRPSELTPWVRLLDSYTGPPWTVDRWALVRSHLGEGPRRRPRHEVLAKLPVGG